MEQVYAWLRRHPWLVDGTLAVVLLVGAANAYIPDAAVLPASLALAGAVAVRRRFPVPAYVVALAIGSAQVIFGIGQTFTNSPLQPTFADVGILILLYTVAAERPRRISLPALAACVALFLAVVVRYNPGGNAPRHQLEFFLVTALLYLLAPTSAWVLGDSIGYRRAYAAALEERAVRAERDRDAQAQIAAAAERGRIARELHDVIAHNLSVMVAQADGGAYAFDATPERSRQALAEIGRTGRQALSEMSSLLGVLRTDREVAPLAPAPAADEIAQLLAQAREAGMNVSYAVEGPARPLSGGLSLAAYRIVQEALTNVRKHAGSGAAAEVTLRYGQDDLLVRVVDDGHGAAGMVGAAMVTGRETTRQRPRRAVDTWTAGHRRAMTCLWSGSSNLAGLPLSLADASVDPFAQQVGVTAVAGVLLDHVDKHFAQRDGVPVSHGPADTQVGRAGDELLREGDLATPGLPGISYHRWIGDRAGPVSIR